MSRIKKQILSKLKEYGSKMGTNTMGGDDYTSGKRGGLRDNDGYDNVQYNKNMPQDESVSETTLFGEFLQEGIESVNEGKVDRVVGHTRYKYVGDGRKGQAIVSGPMKDREKEAIIKRAKEAGYIAKPNMGGGVTIQVESLNEDQDKWVVYDTKTKKRLPNAGKIYKDKKAAQAFADKQENAKVASDTFYFDKIQEESLNEEMGEWPKKLTSRYSGEYRFEFDPTYEDKLGRAKYRVIDIESGELKGTPVFGSISSLKSFADDLIKPQGGTQSTNLGESLNEVEIGDTVKIDKNYGGGKGVVDDKIGSYVIINGESYHESDVKVTKSSLDERINTILEAKKKKKKEKKDPPLNKPERGGSKAYFVYVRDPKTKKIKKVSFGSGGLRAKINNKQARNAFAARHNCKNKKDRTMAGYWSCNLPRYADQLGLGSKMNTFW